MSSACVREELTPLTRRRHRCSTPARGRTKKGYFWALGRDDRPWQGKAPPAVVYSYAPGARRRGGDYAAALLEGCSGVLQTDEYASTPATAASQPEARRRASHTRFLLGSYWRAAATQRVLPAAIARLRRRATARPHARLRCR
jgi:Transposase IS66 family